MKMELHEKFPTRFRGRDLVVELWATLEPTKIVIEAEFTWDGKVIKIENMQRHELSELCRQASMISEGWKKRGGN